MSRSPRHNARQSRSTKKAGETKGYDYPVRGSFSLIAIVLAVGIFLVYSFFTQPEQLSRMLASVHSQEEAGVQKMVEEEGYAVSSTTPTSDHTSGSAVQSASTIQIEFQKKDPAFVVPVHSVTAGQQVEDTVDIEELASDSRQPPLWIENAVPFAVAPDAKKIVIIIDDLGESRKWTKEAITLPPPITLAYLPYPVNIRSYVEAGRQAGHEIMVHMPMEPMSGYDATSDYMLRADMSDDDLLAVLDENLNAFDGYVGINNHMGSRFTQNPDKMGLVMERLKKDGLLFVDSRTIPNSVGVEEAESRRIPVADRDVFLDHVEERSAVDKALLKTERVAQKHGIAIAIGHPKKDTIEALRDWLPTLADKGFTLVPITAAITPPSPHVGEKDAIVIEAHSQKQTP